MAEQSISERVSKLAPSQIEDLLQQLQLPPQSNPQLVAEEFGNLCRTVVKLKDPREIAEKSARIHAISMVLCSSKEGGKDTQAILEQLLLNPRGALSTTTSHTASPSTSKTKIDSMLQACIRLKASDLHLQVGEPPLFRVGGSLRRARGEALNELSLKAIQDELLDGVNAQIKHTFDKTGGTDFSHVVDGVRFRVSLFKASGAPSLVARQVRATVPTFAELGLPPVLDTLCRFSQGFILLAGATGSGKTTTIASMINHINERSPVKIATLEEPIEVLFTNKAAAIVQREIYEDVVDWPTALKQILRQDPDVVLVGEMRDEGTFRAGIEVASTGHLAFGTIHADSAASTVNRILGLFPPSEHAAVRQGLASNLKAIVAQKLVPGLKKERVPVTEIMLINPTVKELIKNAEDSKLNDAIAIGEADGMRLFNTSLKELVDTEQISRYVALHESPNPDQLKMLFKNIKTATRGIL